MADKPKYDMTSLSSREYQHLGMRLVAEEPAIAEKWLSLKLPEPTHTNISHINYYFERYCKLQKTPIKRVELYDFRTLFVGCILKMYQPASFIYPVILEKKYLGIITELSKVLNMDKPAVSRLVRSTITAHKIYDQFALDLIKIMEGLE